VASLQEALDGAQNGQTFVHDSETHTEYLSPTGIPGEVQHDVVAKSEWGMGGRADLDVSMILNNPAWSQTGWEPNNI
jgi:hypothetical protein